MKELPIRYSIAKICCALALACFVGQVVADALPRSLVGVWATDGSVLKGQLLFEGEALYLGADGVGAIVGGPPPIGIKVIASFNPVNGTISLDILEHDKVVGHGAAIYDASTASVSFGDPAHPLLHRRFEEVSSATIKALGL
ncbi:MAG: hypothetical protein M3Z15_08100 [Pseudomonadota bacterium]|nr:hypothetical protein [Pseudomonadota bacterium]